MKERNRKKVVSFVLSGGNLPDGKHVTLWFGPNKKVAGESGTDVLNRMFQRDDLIQRLGEEIGYQEILTLSDRNVLCTVVGLEDPQLYRGSSAPHCTLDCYDDAKPAQSNDLIVSAGISNVFGLSTFKAYISALYYTKDENGNTVKRYSTKISDWKPM